MAVDTLCSNKPIELVEKSDIVDRNWKLNMAGMTGARPRVHATSRTATFEVISFNKQNNISPQRTQGEMLTHGLPKHPEPDRKVHRE